MMSLRVAADSLAAWAVVGVVGHQFFVPVVVCEPLRWPMFGSPADAHAVAGQTVLLSSGAVCTGA